MKTLIVCLMVAGAALLLFAATRRRIDGFLRDLTSRRRDDP